MQFIIRGESTRLRTILFLFIGLGLFHVPASAHIRRANGKIAFVSDRDGNREIYVMNADGSNQVRLTNNPGVDEFPTWSPDGNRIAYFSQDISGAFSIKVMDSDGTNQTVVTPITYFFDVPPYPWYNSWTISWSPDSRRLAFEDYADMIPNNFDIFSVNLDGSHRTNLTMNVADDDQPSWSPDGSRILFLSGRDPGGMYTMNPDGSDVQRLNLSIGGDSPDWSPTGDRIAYVVTPYDGGDFGFPIIYTAKSDGSDPQIFDECSGSCSLHRNSPKWSPDGTKIVFNAWEFFSNLAEIYVKNIDGTGFGAVGYNGANNFHPSWQSINTRVASAQFDFDGDGRSDMSVFRPSDGTWYLDRSSAGFAASQFGISTDQITPADFDGDGKTDLSVYRDGVWYWLNSSNGTLGVVQFGQAGDIPVPADYNGDGRDDLAVYRNGVWWMLDLASNQASVVSFGLPTDRPVPADYDGDGKVDQAVYRDGQWHLNQSTLGYTVLNFGLPTDRPVVADYDGDGKADPAVYRDGSWYLDRTSLGFAAFNWGLSTDVPVPADYDGDGKADPAVFRSGTWYLLQSTNGMSIQQFGLASDDPVQAASLH